MSYIILIFLSLFFWGGGDYRNFLITLNEERHYTSDIIISSVVQNLFQKQRICAY